MKKFLKYFPFLLAFLFVYLLQIKMDAENRNMPFLDPFGRANLEDFTTVNRPAKVLSDNEFVWLKGQTMVFGKFDPNGQVDTMQDRPIPDADIYTYTQYEVIGDDVFWLGKDETLKRSTWQGDQRKWTEPKTLNHNTVSLYVTQVGDRKILLAGEEKALKIWSIEQDSIKLAKSIPTQKMMYLSGSVDAKQQLHVGTVDQLSSESYYLRYLTIDPKTMQVSEAPVIKDLLMPTQSMIDDSVFGLDKTHGYFIMTYRSTKMMSKTMKVHSFPLNDPKAGLDLDVRPNTEMGAPAYTVYAPYAASGQADELKFAFAASYAKNPRVNGNEVFLSSLKDGKWNASDLQRVSNTQRLALNPVFSQQGDTTTVVYSVLKQSKQYEIYRNSNNPTFAKTSNVLRADDYKASAFAIPQYMGIVVVTLFIAVAWPMLSFGYLFFYVFRNEDALFSSPNRHLFVSILLYVVSQIYVFLEYGKLENFHLYAPGWMHSNTSIALLMVGAAVLSYLGTALYKKVAYERNALVEFSYFAGLNCWLVLLSLAYFMAA